MLAETQRRTTEAVFEAERQAAQQRLAPIPVVQGALQGGGDGAGPRAPGQILGDDDERPVAAGLERREFHFCLLPLAMVALACSPWSQRDGPP